jgi:hypothetical protein
MLANIVVYDDTVETDEIVNHFIPKFKKLPLKRAPVRELLVKELLHYHLNFTGKIAAVLKGLYLGLDLNKYARRKLKSKWETQIEGIREITQMSLEEEAENILKFTGDENSLLRMEAQAAFVKLSADNPFRFLDTATERILDWHQLVLFEVITKTKNIQIPSFSHWLASQNDTVVLLCLKLINYYQQLEAVPDLIRLLSHPSPAIRGKSIQVLGNFEAEWAEENLYEIFSTQTVEIKILIIRAMGKIASGNYLEFLRERAKLDTDFKIRMEAMYAIKMHGSVGTGLLEEMCNKTGDKSRSMIEHVLDERILV